MTIRAMARRKAKYKSETDDSADLAHSCSVEPCLLRLRLAQGRCLFARPRMHLAFSQACLRGQPGSVLVRRLDVRPCCTLAS
jgi:hypothetical protein